MGMGWSRRELLRAAAGFALGGAALEMLSLSGQLDHRRLAAIDGAARFGQRSLELDGLDGGGVLHIGQSTHLIALGGLRILTDPWFFDPAFGSLRHARLPVTPQTVGALDVILVTHDHPDHADRRALDRLDKRALVIVGAPSLVAPLRALGFERVEHLVAGRDLELGAVTVTGTLALHDVPETGFVLRSGEQAIYFAGDTALHEELAAIAERWPLSLAILPIDGTRLRWESRLVMDPRDAARATAILRPRQVIGSHADASHGDPIAAHLLSEQAPEPHASFRRLVAAQTPGTRISIPRPGDLIALS